MSYTNNNCFNGYTQCCDEIKYFKEDWICEKIYIPRDKPDILKICEIYSNPIIKNIVIVDTKEGLSNEGQYLSGKKLIVEVLIQTKLNYVGDEPTRGIFPINYEFFKSMFIIVPNEIDSKSIEGLYKSSRLLVSPFVEHTYTKAITPRCFNICILLLLDTKVC